MSSAAAGASLTAVTLMFTTAEATPPWPSAIVYEKLSGPLVFAAGVYVIVPLALTTMVPCEAGPTAAMASGSPSTSTSLLNTSIVTGVSSAVVAESPIATGASFTDATDIATFAVAVPL